jgi:diguanylate cyclase (GGDEF)-like protein
MDTTTLVVANGILFVLYAGVMLVNAKIVGGVRGAVWFAASNLLRGLSMMMVGIEWLHIAPTRYVAATSAVFAVIGAMMLHRAFAELLERGVMMRSIQYALVAVMSVGSCLLLLMPRLESLLGVILCGVLALQYAVVAMLVFRFSGEEVGPAGWLTGMALAIYALTFVVRAYAASEYGVTLMHMLPGVMKSWLIACIITSAATAFGFMSLSTARLRVELQWRAQVDELTGLLNRWALKRLVTREIERSHRSGKPLAVVMIDLDGLKAVNDTAGHAGGDVVLQAVAGVLHETIRDFDAAARMGGDEFCVLLPATTAEKAQELAQRLRQEMDDLVIRYRGETLKTSASFGIATSDVCGLSWQALMDASDSALYCGKRQGKNRVVVAQADTSVTLHAAPKAMPKVLREQGNVVN